jgi:hypothetical protein
MKYHTNVHDTVNMGYMFRQTILPFLGSKETCKMSQISIMFNRIVDYNKYYPYK